MGLEETYERVRGCHICPQERESTDNLYFIEGMRQSGANSGMCQSTRENEGSRKIERLGVELKL